MVLRINSISKWIPMVPTFLPAAAAISTSLLLALSYESRHPIRYRVNPDYVREDKIDILYFISLYFYFYIALCNRIYRLLF